jgi:uncharacterized surface protein with fasciclin (FAS1) repeats
MTIKAISFPGKSIARSVPAFFVAGMLAITSLPSLASEKVSQILDNNGFQTLLFALDTTGLTSVVDENKVTLFAPTDDVFEETAVALGCTDALDLATRLLNIDVNGTDALTTVLTYHVYLGKLKDTESILVAGTLQTANGESITTGVGKGGLYVKGVENAAPSYITTDGIKASKSSYVYAIDSILLPIDPTGVCNNV